MTYQAIAEMIEGIGLPSVYYQFKAGEVPSLPYVIFYYPSRTDFLADDLNFQKITKLVIELYAPDKDFGAETLVENMLEANNLVYTKAETYLDDEKMYMTLYQTEVLINEQS